MNEADLVLWLMDSSINKNDGIPHNIKDKSIEVWTKSDISIHKNKDIIISTKKDQGITQLIDIIGKFVEKELQNRRVIYHKITSSRCIGKN